MAGVYIVTALRKGGSVPKHETSGECRLLTKGCFHACAGLFHPTVGVNSWSIPMDGSDEVLDGVHAHF